MENEKRKECVINGTVVIESEDVTNQIPSHLRSVFAEGALFLLYEKENGECALQIAQELKRSRYRVSCASTDDYLQRELRCSRLYTVRFRRGSGKGNRCGKAFCTSERYRFLRAFDGTRLPTTFCAANHRIWCLSTKTC